MLIYIAYLVSYLIQIDDPLQDDLNSPKEDNFITFIVQISKTKLAYVKLNLNIYLWIKTKWK